MTFDSVVTTLREILWGAAPDWDDRAAAWLWSYYRRLGPLWPIERSRISPADRVIVDAVITRCSEARREQIAAAVRSIRAAADARGDAIESTTRDLLPLIVAWSIAVDAGELSADSDPGAPLLELFRAGFQIQHRHEGIHLHHARGWRIYQLPARDALAT